MDTLTRVTPERFAQGLTLQQFVQRMSKNKDVFEENYAGFELQPADREFFGNLGRPLRVLVLAEDWCSDVLRYLPAFARVCEAAGDWDVRVFYRDQNHDLADLWLKNGLHRAIPVIVFFDEALNELACFIERPTPVYSATGRAREAFADRYPELPDAELPSAEMSEATYNLYVQFMREFRSQHNREWQQLFVNELREKLSAVV